jgi:uncharacterized RDD family membrane protein YckC
LAYASLGRILVRKFVVTAGGRFGIPSLRRTDTGSKQNEGDAKMTPPMMMKLGTPAELTVLQTGTGPEPALQDSGQGDATNWVPAVIANSLPRPWMRYWARMFDLMIAGAAFAIVMRAAGIDVAHWNHFVFSCLALIFWAPCEAALLCACGTTPGKSMFNIRVATRNGSPLRFPQALGRSFAVFIIGLGFGMPIIAVTTLIAAWWKLSRHGRTTWDDQNDTVVTRQPLEKAHILMIALNCIVFFLLIGFGATK